MEESIMEESKDHTRISEEGPKPGKGNGDKAKKDGWDKAEVISKFLVAAFIAFIGIAGNIYLNNKQKADSSMKLYTQLLSDKEQAENTLKKDMFAHILESFLKEGGKNTGTESTLEEIRKKSLNLELLSRNFHESLDMKPLFKYHLLQIVRTRRAVKNCAMCFDECLKSLKGRSDFSQVEFSGKLDTLHESISKAIVVTNERSIKSLKSEICVARQINDRPMLVQKISKCKNAVEHVQRRYDRELDALIKSARRVARKQQEVLEEVSGELELVLPLNALADGRICTKYKPNEWLPEEDGTCQRDNGQCCLVKGFSAETVLELRNVGERRDKKLSRYFKIKVRYAYPRWRRFFVEILSCSEKKGCEERPDGDNEKDTASFWLGSFDFPLVDNTYLNKDERYSVILEDLKEGPEGEPEAAKITLIYYPASYSGLKEKAFYNNQLMRGLLTTNLFKNELGVW
jgi:hypothetical protein